MLLNVVIFSLLLQQSLCYEVDQYTDEDFDHKMTDHAASLVMFYAPWCGHCKNLKPEYARAAEDLSKNDPPIPLVKVDCTESGKATCDKYNIDGYPTLKLFRNGQYQKDYTGPRTFNGIVDFMKSFTGTKYKELKNAEDLKNFTKGGGGEEVHVVAYYEQSSALKEVFEKVVEDLWERIEFGWSSTNEEGVVLYRGSSFKNKFEEDQVKYQGKVDVEDLKKWILKNAHGLAGFRKNENKDDFQPPLVIAYYDVDFEMDPKGTKYWRNRVLKVAKEFEDRANFAISSKNDFQEELNEYGLDNYETNKPIVLALNTRKKKFMMEDLFSVENLTKFVQNFLEEKLEPSIKSAPEPLVNDGPVLEVVAKNFDTMVRDNGNDTLIAFYAPWCSVCKKMAPGYEEFARRIQDEDIEVLKMDATANYVSEEFKVDGYPTLYFLKKDKKKEPMLYDGKKEMDDLIKFVAKHATEELKGWDRDGNVKDVEELKKEEL